MGEWGLALRHQADKTGGEADFGKVWRVSLAHVHEESLDEGLLYVEFGHEVLI